MKLAQAEEQLHQLNPHIVKSVLAPTTDFPICTSGKVTETPRKIDFGGQRDLIREFIQGCVNTLGGYKKNFVCTRTQEKGAVTPTRDWPRCACEYPVVSDGGLGWQWSTAGQRHWIKQCLHKAFWKNLHYLPHNLVLGQKIGREHSPTFQQKIGLKIYWTWPCHQNNIQIPPQSVSPIRKLS